MTSMGISANREMMRDYVAYILTSARGLHREPSHYAPMRMVDGLEKSLAIISQLGLEDPALEDVLSVIRENRWCAGTDPERFGRSLDEAILRLVTLTQHESGGET